MLDSEREWQGWEYVWYPHQTVEEVIQGILPKQSKQIFSQWGISCHQATPTHLSPRPVVISEFHSEVRSQMVGVGEEGGLALIVALSPDARLQLAQLIGKERRSRKK